MRIMVLATLAAAALVPAAAQAQDVAQPQDVAQSQDVAPGSLAGFRVEGDLGWDGQHAFGNHNNKFGYGGSVGFDGNVTSHIVVGPEFSYWRPNNGRNLVVANDGLTAMRSGDTWSASVRAGYRVGPDLLLFGQGGYAYQYQRSYSAGLITDTQHQGGYQYGGGVQYSPHDHFSFVPANAYVSARYVRAHFGNHTSDEHAMAGFGIRFR